MWSRVCTDKARGTVQWVVESVQLLCALQSGTCGGKEAPNSSSINSSSNSSSSAHLDICYLVVGQHERLQVLDSSCTTGSSSSNCSSVR